MSTVSNYTQMGISQENFLSEKMTIKQEKRAQQKESEQNLQTCLVQFSIFPVWTERVVPQNGIIDLDQHKNF